MKEEIDFKAVAAQLAKPQGEAGIRTAERMNMSNGDMTRHAIDLLDCSSGDRVLEIGPGNGRFAAYILSKGTGIQYTGADISETMVHAAREINRHDIEAGDVAFEQTDGISFPFPDESFDKIFTVNTLYFWENPMVQLAEIKRMLKQGATVCIAIASKSFMKTLPFTPYGFTLYSAEDAAALLVKNGFEVLHIDICNRKVQSAADQEMMREEIFMVAR
ncbi:class I SAM-dependent methyltransferase [Parapedobacter tibetensis]|uniref:class I SAM-dependent methyltransferase n=1 Tax=Parapedobacter tibetensis TaxID=2972951 RepID=UPI00214D5B0B|nr:class I SAM-dependent methyltransferase [Parapedobacter tibetensis]